MYGKEESAMAKAPKRTPLQPTEATELPDAGAPGPELPTGSQPDPDRIARRAYELYQARGESEGGALEDWLAAEQELNRSTPDRE
jgi:hypothetical protein